MNIYIELEKVNRLGPTVECLFTHVPPTECYIETFRKAISR